MKRTIIIFLSILVLTSGCSKLKKIDPIDSLTSTTPSGNTELLTTDLILQENSFIQGENVGLTLNLINTVRNPIKLCFSSGRWRPYFSLTDSNNIEVWNSLYGYYFPCLYNEDFIEPGEIWAHKEIWDGRDNEDNLLLPGDYILTAIGHEDGLSKKSMVITIQPIQ